MCKVYTGYCGTSEIEHGLCACMVDNPLAKAWDYLSVQAHKPCIISHMYLLVCAGELMYTKRKFYHESHKIVSINSIFTKKEVHM